MRSFSLTAGWAETTNIIRDHGLALSGFLLILLAALAIVGSLLYANVFSLFTSIGGGTPLEMSNALALNSGATSLANILFNLIFIALTMAIFRYTASDGGAGFMGSLKFGLIAAIPVLFAMIVLIVFVAIAIFVIALGLGLIGVAAMPDDPRQIGSLGIIAIILIYPTIIGFALFILARLGLAGPVMGGENSYNPLTALAKAWTLTRGYTWSLIGYYFLSYVGMTVMLLVAAAIVALLGQMTSILLILLLPVYVIFLLVNTVLPVAAYRLLAGDMGNAEQVAAIFE